MKRDPLFYTKIFFRLGGPSSFRNHSEGSLCFFCFNCSICRDPAAGHWTKFVLVLKKRTLPIAEWSTWSSWGPCSQTCDYGIKQQTRTCSVSGACGGLGLNTLTEYCELGSCLGKSLGKLVAQKLHHQQLIYPLSLKRYFYDTLCGDPDSQRWIPCQCNNSDYYRCSSIKDSGMIHQAIT